MVSSVFLLFVLGGSAPEALVFDRQAILQGEIWRLVTGHWVHSDVEHLAWNLMAFGLLGYMIETCYGHFKLYAALIAGMFSVTVCVWFFVPDLDFYCGLSGVLNTLLFVLLIEGWLTSRSCIFPLVAVGASVKIAFELFQHSAILTQTLWPSVPEAHLAGAIAAVLLVLAQHLLNVDHQLCQLQHKTG